MNTTTATDAEADAPPLSIRERMKQLQLAAEGNILVSSPSQSPSLTPSSPPKPPPTNPLTTQYPPLSPALTPPSSRSTSPRLSPVPSPSLAAAAYMNAHNANQRTRAGSATSSSSAVGLQRTASPVSMQIGTTATPRTKPAIPERPSVNTLPSTPTRKGTANGEPELISFNSPTTTTSSSNIILSPPTPTAPKLPPRKPTLPISDPLRSNSVPPPSLPPRPTATVSTGLRPTHIRHSSPKAPSKGEFESISLSSDGAEELASTLLDSPPIPPPPTAPRPYLSKSKPRPPSSPSPSLSIPPRSRTSSPAPLPAKKKARPVDPRAKKRYENLFELCTARDFTKPVWLREREGVEGTVLESHIVAFVWKRSGLGEECLRGIWNELELTEKEREKGLEKDNFVRGMWRIDETLRMKRSVS